MSAANIQFFLNLRETLKIHHWQTYSFSTHKATDEAIDTLDKLIDSYTEIYIGKYGRPHMTRSNNMIVLKNLSKKTITKFIKACIAYMHDNTFLKGLDMKKDSDLINIRDELVGSLNQLLYLFTLE
jgi:hypothetical protein